MDGTTLGGGGGSDYLFGGGLGSPSAFLVYQYWHRNAAQYDKPREKLSALLYIGKHPGCTNMVDEDPLGWC